MNHYVELMLGFEVHPLNRQTNIFFSYILVVERRT